MRILVVDDSAIIRRLIRKELEGGGYQVFEAVDGEEALRKVEEVQPYLITLDVHMPTLDGYEVCERLRQDTSPSQIDRSRIPIILVTAKDTIDGRSKGFQVGASHFIRKPFVPGEVLTAVNNLLRPDDRLQGLTALIIDDSTLARNILVNCLQGHGINILEADDGASGFDLLQRHQNEIDLIVTDLIMKQMNGDEFCRKVRHELGLKEIPIIVLSAMSEKNSVLELFLSGATDYLMKPFAKEELLARIDVHLEVRLLNKRLSDRVIELKRLNKLKDEFLAIASHDLRSPLNGILGITDLILEKDYFTNEDREWLNHIKQSGDFLLYLINDILDLSQLQSGNSKLELSPLPLDKISLACIQTLTHTAYPKLIQLEFINKFEKGPLIKGDKNGLTRIFNNLLSNAIKFTPKNGKVTILIEPGKNPQRVSVSIIDTGIGIPKDKIPILFNKFSKASQSGTAGEKGTGLGLSITKELVGKHGSMIKVASEEGKGTCFQFMLTLASESPEKVEKEKAEESQEELGAPVRILLVEDNKMNIKLAETVLRKNNFEVITVENGQLAVDKVKKLLHDTYVNLETGEFEIVLMDVQMPVMDGFEAAREIRKLEKAYSNLHIPIIAMTSFSSPLSAEQCIESGMDAHITKPIKIVEIKKAINRVFPD